MATYIKDDSLENLTQSLQFLAQLQQRRKAQDLETYKTLLQAGDDRAEEYLLRSQRGIIGNLFGEKAKGFEVDNPHRGEDIALKQERYTADADQGGLLAQMKKENPDMYKYMTEQEQRKPGLAGLAERSINPFQQSDTADKFNSQIQAYNQMEAANAPIRDHNARAKTYNDTQASFGAKTLTGNEYKKMQDLMKGTFARIKAGGGMEAYLDYITTGKAIADHYQHDFRPMQPEAFGIGVSGGGGKGEKPKMYNIVVNGKKVDQIGLTDSMLLNPDLNSYIIKKYPNVAKRNGLAENSFTVDPAGSDTGMNTYEQGKADEQQMLMKDAELAKAKNIRSQTASFFSGSKTDIDNANKALAAQGSRVRYDYDGNEYFVDSPANIGMSTVDKPKPEEKNEEKKQPASYKSKGLW